MTFTKSKLKNMFLLKLEERLKPNSGVSPGADAIIPSLNSDNLTDEEKKIAWEGFEELKIQGILTLDPEQRDSSVFTNFTQKGKRYLENLKIQGIELEPLKVELRDLITDDGLISACLNDFENENYWNAINNAMRHLEVRVRRKSNLSNDSVGFKLMSEAFKAQQGKLQVNGCNTDEEKDGFQLIMMGVMKFHRNQKAHDEGVIEPEKAVKIIGYIDYLLGLVENCSERS